MADKLSPFDRAKIALDMLKQRHELSRQFKSGEIDQKRKEKFAAGDYPWRILRYPRIINPNELGYPIGRLNYVKPKTLEKHLIFFAKEYRIVSLDQLIDDILNDQPIPEKTIAITFDGGWVDQFSYAAPLLKKFQIPATFFLPTGFVGTTNYFWQDKVMFVLLMMQRQGINFIPFGFFSDNYKSVLNEISPDGTITLELARAILIIVSSLPEVERTASIMFFGEMMEHLGGALPQDPCFMSWEEVKLLSRIGATFGTLGHRHREISDFSSPDEFHKDALESFEMLDINGVAGARILASVGDMMSPDFEKFFGNLKVCDSMVGIKLPNSGQQIIHAADTLITLRQHISDEMAGSIEELATLIWI